MDYPTREEIRSLCTGQSFQRGINYYNQGRIQALKIDDGEITATVRGTHDYEVSINVMTDPIHTYCSCPYDYAGVCKHIVAVLLAVNETENEQSGSDDISAVGETMSPSDSTDVQALVEQVTAEDPRTFLLDVIEDDHSIRDRFVAFAGGETNKTIYDYKQELNRLFENAVGRRGMIEYNTHIDVSQYHDLAKTHRARGNVTTATDIYRALAESIRENLNRIDDSGGYYGRELERAIEAYAETVSEQPPNHDDKQQYIEYLVEEFIEADYAFVREDYEEALRRLCTTSADLESWLALLNSHVPDLSVEPTAIEDTEPPIDTDARQTHTEDESRTRDDAEPEHERTDDTLYVSDFTNGPLTIDDFTGETLDVEHLAVDPLELGYFVGEAFEELRVDEPTTVEEHPADTDPPDSGQQTGMSVSVRTRRVLSSYLYLLEELDEDDAVLTLYEEIYLENSQFHQQYVTQLIERGDEERAVDVVEDGLNTFRSTTTLRWLAADLYRGRKPDKYRETLKQLFLDHSEWDAYDDLKAACDDQEWDSIHADIVTYLADNDRRRLIDVYITEGELETAFSEVVASENLSWFRRYQGSVADVDPEAYFEAYKELLIPFAAEETGRRHYKKIVNHLEQMEDLIAEDQFREFVDALKDKHSNRPAFLDEFETAGF